MKLNIQKVMVAGAEKKMNFTDIAKAACLAPQTVFRIKKNQPIHMKTAGKIAEVLGVSVTELMEV